MAQMAAIHFDTMVGHSLEELELTARQDGFDLEDGNLEPEKQALKEIYPQLVIFSYNVFVVDRDGRVIWTEPYDAKLVGADLSRQADVSAALLSEKPYVSGLSYVFYTFSSDRPVVLLMVPVRSSDGRVTGVLGGAIDLNNSSFSSFITPIQIGKTGHIQLIDERGMVLAGSEKGERFRKWHHADMMKEAFGNPGSQPVGRFPVVHQGVESGTDVLAFVRLHVARWGVAVEQDVNEAFAPTRRLQLRLALLAGVTLTVAVVVVIASVRNVIGPVKDLTRASKAIAAGDLTTPVKVSGPDEIGVLSRSFDVMRQELHQSRLEIEKWNKELEDRVRQRTRELSAMFEVSQTVASTFNLEALMSTVIRRTVSMLQPADLGVIFLADHSSRTLAVRAIHAAKDSLVANSRLRIGETIATDLSDSETAVCRSALQLASSVNGAEVGPIDFSVPAGPGSRCTENAVCIPLISKGQTIGCMLLLAIESRVPFTDSDRQIFQALAAQVAVAIENARLAEEASMVQALKKADRLKTEFISTVSHELRTPLASIKGYTTTLLRDDTDWNPEAEKEFLQIIDEESDKLRELIDNLLEMSKMEAGFLTIERQPVLIPKIAAKTVADLSPRAKRHRFTMDFPHRFPVLEADPRRIDQILHNLLENAVKYSPNGGNITVRGAINAQLAEITVSDEGVGMTAEETEKIFDRFYRGDNALTKRTAGSGLGLSIARGLVEAQGGRIWVVSVPGQGSTFHFTVPLSENHGDELEEHDTIQPRMVDSEMGGSIADEKAYDSHRRR